MHNDAVDAALSPAEPAEAVEAGPEAALSLEKEERIEAYACLQFPDPPFTFYLKKLSVTVGRRPTPVVLHSLPYAAAPYFGFPHQVPAMTNGVSPRLAPTVSAARSTSPMPPLDEPKQEEVEDVKPNIEVQQEPPTAAEEAKYDLVKQEQVERLHPHVQYAPPPVEVDVDLGAIKAVSRDHARIYYDYPMSSWALEVRGRNGVMVSGKWRARNEVVRLGKRTRIQIAERIFYFVLPEGADEQVTDDVFTDSTSDSDSPLDTLAAYSEPDAYSLADSLSEPSSAYPSTSTAPAAAGPAAHRHKRHPKRPARLAHDYAYDGPDDDDFTPKRAHAAPARPAAAPSKPKGTKKKGAAGRRAALDPDETLEKPPYSYASLVAQAIDRTEPVRGVQKLTSAAICEWIATVFPYYSKNPDGLAWQNSIQQALSNNVIFIKVPRQEDEPGKGNFWTMDPQYLYLFDGDTLTQLTAKDAPKSVSKSRTSTRQVRASEKLLQAQQHADEPAPPPAVPTRTSSRRERKPTAAVLDAAPLPPAAPAAAPAAPEAKPAVAEAPPPEPPTLAPAPTPPPPPVKLVIGPPPPDWTPPTYTDEPKTELHRLIRQANPIIWHNGAITLSPVVFRSMKPDELDRFARLEKEATLKLLQQYMVEHFKSEIKKAKKSHKRKADDGSADQADPPPKQAKMA